MTLRKILTGDALTLVLPGRADPFVMSRDHKLFPQLLSAVKLHDIDEILDIIDISTRIEQYAAGKVTVRDGVVFYGEEALHNEIAERILELISLDLDFEFMAKFLENLMENPSKQSIDELYLFMENGKMPITDDGRLLAYKWVRSDYMDVHTGRFSKNTPGAVIKMQRSKVNDDRRQTCSSGLHVCTHAYEKFGEKLMLVAVNPRDVVSVPHDYDNAKMRVSEYEVLEEINADQFGNHQTRAIYAN